MRRDSKTKEGEREKTGEEVKRERNPGLKISVKEKRNPERDKKKV